jgi:serine-type D-Ala-D-Ala carboxypeptidase/endopeptidase (penicillin-binding protein 4)
LASLRHKLSIGLACLAAQVLFGLPPLPAATWSQLQGQFLEKAAQSAGSVGVHVAALPSGRVLWSHQANEPMIPASLLKVATSYAALKTLGPAHRFKTGIWATSPPHEGILPSGIWIRSEGDIFWTFDQAKELALKIKERGIRIIRGSIRVDDSYFTPPFERVCLDDACEDLYNPMVSGTAMEFNSVVLRARPSTTVGKPPQIEWFPPGRFIQFTNLAKTGPRRSKNTLSVRQLAVGPNGVMRFQVAGRLPVSAGLGLERRFTVADPSIFVAAAFSTALEQAGIRVEDGASGSMGPAPIPPGAQMLAETLSTPLAETIYGLNRHSNNFMAEMLLRSLGAVTMGFPGSESKGIVAVNKILKAMGAPAGQCEMKTGSGLSRACRVSPFALSKVLVGAYSDAVAGPAFLESLAVNGQEGTLRRRLSNSSVLVKGKTGTLSDVVGFAGYVSSGGRAPYAVVVMLNEVHQVQKAKEALDSFLENLALCAPSE